MKASRFDRLSRQEANYISKTSANDTEEEMEVVVKEMAKHEDVSPFVDLEAYRGQDDRQAKSLGTPGLLKASHYMPDGKVNLHESHLTFVCSLNHVLCFFSHQLRRTQVRHLCSYHV